MNQIQQIFIVTCIVVTLPFVAKLLWKLCLLPLGCWLVATQFIWPKWAAENEKLCFALLVSCVLFFLGAWIRRYAAMKRREKEWLDHVLASALVWEYRQNAFHGETE